MSVHSSAPELLAPAGDWDALRAAVANGADAVYFGLSNFNARHRATNFSAEELPSVMRYLHERNVLGYVTLNTLIFSDELEQIASLVETIALAGADAVIVQDMGLARLIRRLAPELPVHGSTQMTLTEPRGIEMVRSIGVERVILARELSVDDIAKIRSQTDVPVEVFIHGALCVAYSGQCLTSEALGGRSANRGQCAQACRLPYDLIVDGKHRDTGDRNYLLSPQDLAAYDIVDKLAALGVTSLKIEGRLKSAEYVAATTQTYRAAIDAASRSSAFELSPQGKLDLAQTYSRGFTPGFLAGVDHQRLVQGRFPKSRGVRVAKVRSTTPRGVLVLLERDIPDDVLKPGDGVVFDQGHPDQAEQGGRIFEVRRGHQGPPNNDESSSRTLELRFGRDAVDSSRLAPGDIVWKTDDPALRKRLQRTFAGDPSAKPTEVTFELQGRAGGPLALTIRDGGGRSATATWPGPLQLAIKHPITIESAREQLDRLHDSKLHLLDVVMDLPEPVMVPKSVLNDLRREVVTKILALRSSAAPQRTVERAALDTIREELRGRPRTPAPESPQLYVLARKMEQVESVLSWRPAAPLARPAMIYCDFEDVRRYREAVDLCRGARMPVGLATLRVLKPGEEGWLSHIARCEADAVLVRNLASVSYFREHAPNAQLIGDYSLNVANELTADLAASWGLKRLVPSYDLNWEQFVALLEHSDPGMFEAVIHQHMPMFHMEHCVFAAMLSSGKDFRDCGRPCDHHRVELRDRVGAEFPLLADTGCRNTVFNSVAQSAAQYVPRMLKLGIRHFRIDLLRETAAETPKLLESYARVLAGQEGGQTTWRQLQVLNQLGVTRGTLQVS